MGRGIWLAGLALAGGVAMGTASPFAAPAAMGPLDTKQKIGTDSARQGAAEGPIYVFTNDRSGKSLRRFHVTATGGGVEARTTAAPSEGLPIVLAQTGNAAGEPQQPAPAGQTMQTAPQTMPPAPPMTPPAGQMPMGQAPMGQMPMGQMPMGQMPMGQAPTGQMPMGQMPMGQMPMGQAPMGQMPTGQVPAPLPGGPQPGLPDQPPVAGQPTVPTLPGQLPQTQPAVPLPGQPVVQADTTGDAGARAILDFARQVTQIQSPLQAQAAVPAGWDRYVDSGTGMVSAAFPKGWTINPVVRGMSGLYVQYAQVQISSPDGYNYVEGVTTQQSTYADPDAMAQQLVSQYGARFGIRRVMLEDAWSVPRQLMPINFVFRAVEAGDYVLVVVTSSSGMSYGGVAMSFLGYRVVVGPTAQFSSLAQSTYIPILSSMLGW